MTDTDLPPDTTRRDDGRLHIENDHAYALSRGPIGATYDVYDKTDGSPLAKGCKGRDDTLVVLDGVKGARS